MCLFTLLTSVVLGVAVSLHVFLVVIGFFRRVPDESPEGIRLLLTSQQYPPIPKRAQDLDQLEPGRNRCETIERM